MYLYIAEDRVPVNKLNISLELSKDAVKQIISCIAVAAIVGHQKVWS